MLIVILVGIVVLSYKALAPNKLISPVSDPGTKAQKFSTAESWLETRSESDSSSTSRAKVALATLFWVGEPADASNEFIANHKSAWDSAWERNFGGLDDPSDRCGYHPCKFTPQENPFYFALPYNDLNPQGLRKESATKVPWFTDRESQQSILKNAWIKVSYHDRVCYGQWQDVGPFETDDFDYVFGDSPAVNTRGVGAGIDLSPAWWDCLQLDTNDQVLWEFVNEEEVPVGPWKEIITTTDVNWIR